MAEPTSSATMAVATYVTVFVTSLVPGVNSEALIGAFAGSTVFAAHATELSILKRVVYMAVSLLIGYMGVDEVQQHTWITSDVIASFALSAVIITLALATIDRIRDFDITRYWRRR